MSISKIIFEALSWGLFGLGLYRLIEQEFICRQAFIPQAPKWTASFLNTGILIWCLGCTLFLFRELSASYLPPLLEHIDSASVRQSILQSFPFHIAVLAFAFGNKLLRSSWPWPKKTATTQHPWSDGFWAYCTALPLIGLTTLIWTGLLNLSAHLGFSCEASPQALVNLIQETQAPLDLALLGIFAIIIAPLSEEYLFRAGLYRLFKSQMPLKWAIVLSALSFSALHWNTLSFLPLFLLGILLNLAYETTGSIRSAFVFHALFNAQNFIYILVDPSSLELMTQ